MAGLLAEETVASTPRGATVVKMSDMMTASQKRAYAKPEVEMEHGVGTGLLSEEMQERRKSLVGKKMADLALEVEEPPPPPKAKEAVAIDGVELKAAAPQKGVKKTDHVIEHEAVKTEEEVHLAAVTALSPEWSLVIATLHEMSVQIGASHLQLSEQTEPTEAYTKVVAAYKRGPKRPELPARASESADNTERRRKVQRGCASLIVPLGEHEGQVPFNQRLDAIKRLSALRDGPHVVPVLPQGKAESPAQARMRCEARS